MGQLFEYIKMALSNIKMNKGRSFLTMLGIIIGVSSVILIMSIGNGAKSEMENELTSVAGGQIYIYANSNLDGEIPTVTAEDRDALRKLPGVKGVSSMAGSILNNVKTGKGNFEAVVVIRTRIMSIPRIQPCFMDTGLPGMITTVGWMWRFYQKKMLFGCLGLLMWWGLRLKWMMEVPLRMSGL